MKQSEVYKIPDLSPTSVEHFGPEFRSLIFDEMSNHSVEVGLKTSPAYIFFNH